MGIKCGAPAFGDMLSYLVGKAISGQSYPTEIVTDVFGFRTTNGAGNVPVVSCTATATTGTVPVTLTLRRQGKNQLDKSTVFFKKGYALNATGGENVNSNYAYSTTYIPVIPGARYVGSGFIDRLSGAWLLAGTYATVHFYDANKQWVSRYYDFGANANPYFTVPSNAHYFRFNINNGLIDTDGRLRASAAIQGVVYPVELQFEITDDPTATTVPATTDPEYYEEYTKHDYNVEITALNTPTKPTSTVSTRMGENVFFLFPQGSLENEDPITVLATFDMTYRVNP